MDMFFIISAIVGAFIAFVGGGAAITILMAKRTSPSEAASSPGS